jgi:hypothetical protein
VRSKRIRGEEYELVGNGPREREDWDIRLDTQ